MNYDLPLPGALDALEGASQLRRLELKRRGLTFQLTGGDVEGLLARLPQLQKLMVPPDTLTEAAQAVLARNRPDLQTTDARTTWSEDEEEQLWGA